MSKIEVRSFDEAMRGAAISGELYRAEKRGIDQGIDQGISIGERNIIVLLLEKYSPEEVCQMIGKDIEYINDVIASWLYIGKIELYN